MLSTPGMKPNFLLLLVLLFLLVSRSGAASDDRHGNSDRVQQLPQPSFGHKPLRGLDAIVNLSKDGEKMDSESQKWNDYSRKSSSGAGGGGKSGGSGSQSIRQPHFNKSNALMFTPCSYLKLGFLCLAFFLA